MEALSLLPGKVEEVLRTADSVCEEIAKLYSNARDFLYLGRGIHYPIALEGALKLKEISYIHAEGYPAGEMKHGPNALIDETLPVVVLATKDESNRDSVLRYEKTLSNIQEVTARSGKVIAVAIEGDNHIRQLVDHVLYVPSALRAAAARARRDPAAVAGLPHRSAPRLRRRPAAQPGEVRNSGIACLVNIRLVTSRLLHVGEILLRFVRSTVLSVGNGVKERNFHIFRHAIRVAAYIDMRPALEPAM